MGTRRYAAWTAGVAQLLLAGCPTTSIAASARWLRSFSPRRICDMDRFEVADWFLWPWYRRWYWPCYWSPNRGMGVQCSLGKFQPVTEAQLAAIEDAIDSY